jgi:ubiquitin-like-conjugating enzyme ATG3
MSEIPDITDSPTMPAVSAPSADIASLSLEDKKEPIPDDDEIPDMDDIPDMEDEAEGLEDEGDDAAVKIVHPNE